MDTIVSAFESGVATHAGKVRPHNEDSCLARPEIGIWAVADGMGGHDAGDVASALVVEALGAIERAQSAADLLARCEQSMADAARRLNEIAVERGGLTMGTTLAALLTCDREFMCVWAGDSRVYRVRDGGIMQVSRDHSEVEEFIASGVLTREEAKNWVNRNVITRAIGTHGEVELDVERGFLEPQDTFVICSDGLTACVEDEEIRECVDANTSQSACDALVALALERGSPDNVTVVVARYQPAGVPSRTGHSRVPDNLWE